jgi:two-component system, cell cycle sensor histidine kinase and response regulator CckA
MIAPMDKTVLLVEDEEQVLRLVVKVLEMRGYSVLQADSSHEALKVSENHLGPIDLLLADVELDGEMTGTELASLLRRTRPGMRVLYTSGYPLDCCIDHGGGRIRAEVMELMADFMPKPFTLTTLTENVRKAIYELPA